MKSKLESLENTPKENMRRNKRSVYECENYSNQMERVKCFMNTLFKFTLGSSNLDGLLGSQRSVLNKQWIGYTGQNSKIKARKFVDISKPLSNTCFYFNHLGHASKPC